MKRFNLLIFFISLYLFSCSADNLKEEKQENNLFYDKAFSYQDSAKLDSAFLYFNKAKELYLQQKDSLGVGKCLVNMAIISSDKGDYFGAQEISLNALLYFNKGNEDHHVYLKSNFNNLGIATYKLKDYRNALKFYDSAIKFSKDSVYIRICLNNKAKTYQELKNYKEALRICNIILRGVNKNVKEYARTLTNISLTKWLQNPNYNAGPDLLKALTIREQENDLWGQNSSYAHLADYYAKNQPDSALIYADKMYQVSKKINSPDDQLQALYKLVKLSPSKESKNYFVVYEKLNDSLQTARASAKNQFALIRYETEKHKADNLVLQKDNSEKRYLLIKQKALLYGTIFVSLAAAVIGVFLYKRRKQRLELEAQDAIRKNQLKTSKKVHDVVANGLYRVMTEIENKEDWNREHLLDKLEEMYEKSRNLSYEELKYSDQNFHEKITSLLKSFASETIKVVIAGNTKELWTKVNMQIKFEIEHVLQELMVNMKKHSSASHVAIRFEQKSNEIAIYYADNGIGMLPTQQFKNGLTNTGNRIISIDGEIIFDTKAEKGLKIQISFPIS